MAGRVFVDTNVLLYLYDGADPDKQERAKRSLAWMESGNLVLSTQVLQEFYWNATRKLRPPLQPADAATVVASLARNPVVVVDPPIILAAVARSGDDRIAFWDALIVESALSAGCERLLTEDLQHGRAFGPLRVENPFLP